MEAYIGKAGVAVAKNSKSGKRRQYLSAITRASGRGGPRHNRGDDCVSEKLSSSDQGAKTPAAGMIAHPTRRMY
jgi:hypothetical protein